MKIKKASIFSLVLALALVAAVTTGFATSAANATEPDSLGLVQMEFDSSKTFEKSINLADTGLFLFGRRSLSCYRCSL